MDELSQALVEQVDAHADRANALMEAGLWDEALAEFQRGLDVLPEPKTKWEAYSWFTVSIADAYFQKADFEACRAALFDTLSLGDEELEANPFVQLRYGQALLELGNEDLAADWLARALMTVGSKLFAEDDPKYLKFICARLRPPEGYESWDEVFADEGDDEG